jgi:hypothetical protein
MGGAAACGVALAVVILLLVALAVAGGVSRPAAPCGGGGFDTGGPYNIGLYDSPRYYPFYQARNWLTWDPDRRCVAYCRGGGCTLSCH